MSFVSSKDKLLINNTQKYLDTSSLCLKYDIQKDGQIDKMLHLTAGVSISVSAPAILKKHNEFAGQT